MTRYVTGPLVRLLLFRSLAKMFGAQLYLKFTKFTRRTREPKDLLRKVVRGCEFLNDLLHYDLDVIRASRVCLARLAAQQVSEVAVYGERHIVEILCQLAHESPVHIKRVYGDDDAARYARVCDVAPLDQSVNSREPVIVASLMDIERKKERLRMIGVEEERVIVLV